MDDFERNSGDLAARVAACEGKIRILSTYQTEQQRKLETAVEKLTEIANCLKENEDGFSESIKTMQKDIKKTWEDDRHGLIHIGLELTEIKQSVRVATWVATTLGGVALTMAASYFSFAIFGFVP